MYRYQVQYRDFFWLESPVYNFLYSMATQNSLQLYEKTVYTYQVSTLGNIITNVCIDSGNLPT